MSAVIQEQPLPRKTRKPRSDKGVPRKPRAVASNTVPVKTPRPRPVAPDPLDGAVNRSTEPSAAQWVADGRLHIVLSLHFTFESQGFRWLAYEARVGHKHVLTGSTRLGDHLGRGGFMEEGNSVQLLNYLLADPKSELNRFLGTFEQFGKVRAA